MDRRTFIKSSALAAGSLAFMPFESFAERTTDLPFRISLAEWSLHRNLQSGKIDNLDFPKIARREFGIDAVEFVDQFFADKSNDQDYLKELKSRVDGEGVYSHLIMVDTNGPLGAADKSARATAVEKTKPWIDAAKFLGCRLVRVNAYGDGNADELRARVAESCAALADYAQERGLSIAIENHGKLSSDPEWLISLIREVNKENFGALPDFGNFPEGVNRYDAVEALMPLAKAVSAKSQRFNAYGLITDTDYFRMMRIVRDAGYSGYVGIESAPEKAEDEYQAIRDTLHVLQLIRDEQSKCIPIFNGQNLSGWTPLFGGEWRVENGILIGKNGEDWSTDPSKSGSWLSTRRQYADFRLELQFAINKGGNSGVFIRSSHRENPAFTGYEVQIYDASGAAPSTTGPGSLYDLVAPTQNLIRKPGEWNSLTVVAKGEMIRVEMNGEKILETHKRRSMKGYIGLQNHDEKSEIRFKNIRLEEF